MKRPVHRVLRVKARLFCFHLAFTPDFFVCLSDNVPLLNEQSVKTGEGNTIFLPSPAKSDEQGISGR
jgi:hypothetical protein